MHVCAETAYSWHIHYLHNETGQEPQVLAFQTDFCAEFGKYGADGASLTQSGWGPNNIAPDATAIYTNCPSIGATAPATTACGNGVCQSGGNGPWSVCQGEIFIPSQHIDEVSAWVEDWLASPENALAVMRHPNTGCQWGDHSPDIRATFFSDPVPEMCLWEVRSKRRRRRLRVSRQDSPLLPRSR